MAILNNLQPAEIWEFFDQILEIPRPSKNEVKIRDFLVKFAISNKLSYQIDGGGNLVIRKDPTRGMEKRKKVILQSHLDMVGEKNSDVIHDFSKDPIIPRMEGDWIMAAGTTLGADDGIGIAAQMAVLSSNTIQHGPLECLFTVDEETGLTGAMALEKGFIDGSILLNLDSEDEGELFIGCAGGIDTLARFKYKTRIFPFHHLAYNVKVSGLKGGHSGDEIHKSPTGNSNKILARFLWNVTRYYRVRLAWFDGGNLRNAIPREAEAIVVVPEGSSKDFENYFNSFQQTLYNELKYREPNLKLELSKTHQPETVINIKVQKRLINSIYACPHGVIKWSDELEGLVETSTNLASVKFTDNNTILVTTSQRSSLDSGIRDISDRIESLFSLANAKVWHTDGYPGWSPDKNSEIVKLTAKTYQDLFGIKPVVRAIHAGLECGLFLQKYPELDMISFGPTIKGAHSPDERLSIESTEKFWKLLLEVLKRIPEEE